MKKMKFCFLLLFLTIAPTAYHAQENFRVKKSSFNFELIEKEGKCVLSYTKNAVTKELVLDVAPKCKVLRMEADDRIIQHYYNDIKATAVMVGGEIEKGKCKIDTAASTQVILIRTNSVKLGQKRGGTCFPDGPDEKEIWLGAH